MCGRAVSTFDGLGIMRRLPGRILSDVYGCERLKRMLDLRGGAVPNRDGNGSLCVVPGWDVFGDGGLERERVRRLLVG